MTRVDDACALVKDFLKSFGPVMIPHLFAINLVLREGLTNAVRHGNKGDPEKLVRLELWVEASRAQDLMVQVKIQDQGQGFDWQQVQNTPLTETEDHGRGLPIMKSYFTACRYNTKGNILYLEKQIPSEL